MKVLVVSPIPIQPQTAGNRVRVRSLLETLRALGHEVHFAHIGREVGNREATRMEMGERYHEIPCGPGWRETAAVWRAYRKIGRILRQEWAYQWGVDDWYDRGCDTYLRSLQREIAFDAVIVVYVFLSKALECFGAETVKLIDTNDVFTDRQRLYLAQGTKPQWFATSAREEAKGLRRADVVIAIRDSERSFFERLSGKRVITVGHTVHVGCARVRSRDRSGPNLLFVASENSINVDGLSWFLREVFPEVRAQVPDVTFLLAGGICDHVPQSEGVEKLGRVPQIADAYAQADVVVNPVQFGTGLNIKSIEALGFGLPLVSTSSGARGLEGEAGRSYVVADGGEEFARRIIELLRDETRQAKLSETAREFARNWNLDQTSALADVLSSIRAPH